MKSLLSLLVLFAALTVNAQSTNAPVAKKTPVAAVAPKTATNNAAIGFQAQHGIITPETTYTLTPLKPNQLVKGDLLYSGIGVEILKTRRPLELLNPLAGPEYGSPEDNVVRDPINGQVTGLKLFSIRF